MIVVGYYHAVLCKNTQHEAIAKSQATLLTVKSEAIESKGETLREKEAHLVQPDQVMSRPLWWASFTGQGWPHRQW